jgi:hypothetical protein
MKYKTLSCRPLKNYFASKNNTLIHIKKYSRSVPKQASNNNWRILDDIFIEEQNHFTKDIFNEGVVKRFDDPVNKF